MEGRSPAPPLPLIRAPPNPSTPYREDCWSEGETQVLVDAWGDRFLDVNRGHLRQKDWQFVADAVNSRRSAFRRPPRTDIQCKNRIDTVKKKYKSEKAKNSPSTWPFFTRLDSLINSSPVPNNTKQSPSSFSSPPLALPLSFPRKASPLPTASPVVDRKIDTVPLAVDDSILRRAQAAAAAAEDSEEESEGEAGSMSEEEEGRGGRRGREGEEGDGIRELAGAVMRFAEIYERVEVAKHRQMMELEKQRMEFAKELEFQRMQMFVDSQVQIAKFKRAKRSDSESYL